MHGTVVTIAVAVGDQLAAGDLVAVLEAMKMENPVTAHQAGTVAEILTAVGAAVPAGAPLIRLAQP